MPCRSSWNFGDNEMGRTPSIYPDVYIRRGAMTIMTFHPLTNFDLSAPSTSYRALVGRVKPTSSAGGRRAVRVYEATKRTSTAFVPCLSLSTWSSHPKLGPRWEKPVYRDRRGFMTSRCWSTDDKQQVFPYASGDWTAIDSFRPASERQNSTVVHGLRQRISGKWTGHNKLPIKTEISGICFLTC
jgi:hypothetical protein